MPILHESSSKVREAGHYVRPIVRWLNGEWFNFRRLLLKTAASSIKELPEAFGYDAKARLNILGFIESSIAPIRSDLTGRVSEAKRQLNLDFRRVSSDAEVTFFLDADSVAVVLSALDDQFDRFDSAAGKLSERVSNFIDARYGTVSDAQSELNHLLRIDKEELVRAAAGKLSSLADSLKSGRMDGLRFKSRFLGRLGIEYRRAFRRAKGSALEQAELDFVSAQVDSQEPFLDRFIGDVEARVSGGEELASAVNARARLYAGRVSALYEAGWVRSLPDDVLLDWELGIAEHCRTCPIYASNSPYLKSTLPGLPGSGFSLTECGTNCKCSIQINELSEKTLDF